MMTEQQEAALRSYQRHVSSFQTPPGCDGPDLRRSFGCNIEYVFEFALNPRDSMVTLNAYRHAGEGQLTDWNPADGPPPTGDFVATLYEGPLENAPLPGPDSNEG